MPFAVAGRDYMLDQFVTGRGTHLSLHSAYSATGGNELTGGGYARVAPTYAAASGGSKALAASVAFQVPAGSTVGWVGWWSQASGGIHGGMTPLTGADVTAPPAAYTAAAATDVLTAPGHAFVDGDTVVVFPGAAASLPAGLTAGTVYHVRDVAGATLKLAASQGGAAINLTGDGAGIIMPITVETFASAGVLTVAEPTVGDLLTLV
ncbi:hypothetical protein HNP84_007329 [Thermocatellispora tengchongensis]|uniref:Uncharacterized protein n=1 Tax=Thermocatellispora tengchongensis TaxID=1073253 RepID=A0A840PKI2_9ACTN|nr:hypothetical protein [Thermocatellispora tengchongensis]MBB5137577.1 hypothetical protein [Thermocatellispora tengchongensis]